MSQKFRTISNAVLAGKKFSDSTKNQRNVTYFMEADGSAHVCTLTDNEKVRPCEFSAKAIITMSF